MKLIDRILSRLRQPLVPLPLPPPSVYGPDQCEMAFRFTVGPLSDEQARRLLDAIVALVEARDQPTYLGGGFNPCREVSCDVEFNFVVEPLSDAQAKRLFDIIVALVQARDQPTCIDGGFHPWQEEFDDK